MSATVRRLRGSSSPLELIMFSLLLTIFLGMVVNSAETYINGVPASTSIPNGIQPRYTNVSFDCAHANITACTQFDMSFVLNPNSPFTDLVHSNFIGFVNGFFKVNNTITGFSPVNNASAANPIWIASCSVSGVNTLWIAGGLNPVLNLPYTQVDNFLKHAFVLECSPPAGYHGVYSVTGSPVGQLWFYCKPDFTDITTCSHMPLMTNQNIAQILHLSSNLALTDYTCSSYNPSTKVSGLTPLWLTGQQVLNPVLNVPAVTSNNALCGQEGVSTVNVNVYLNAFFGIIEAMLGGALIFLSLGLRVGALTGLIGVNDQGTRLSQSFGFGLLLWGMVTSEFGTSLWAIIPFGFGTLFNLLVTAIFFTGLWERSLSWR